MHGSFFAVIQLGDGPIWALSSLTNIAWGYPDPVDFASQAQPVCKCARQPQTCLDSMRTLSPGIQNNIPFSVVFTNARQDPMGPTQIGLGGPAQIYQIATHVRKNQTEFRVYNHVAPATTATTEPRGALAASSLRDSSSLRLALR
jgi:hypothetical protein